MVTLALEPGPATAWTLAVDDMTDSGTLETIDVAAWLDRVIRGAHRTGRSIRVVVVEPSPQAGPETTCALRLIRRVLDIYDSAQVEWR